MKKTTKERFLIRMFRIQNPHVTTRNKFYFFFTIKMDKTLEQHSSEYK